MKISTCIKFCLVVILFGQFLTTSSIAQERIWNESKTMSIIPVNGWDNESEDDRLVVQKTKTFSILPFIGMLDISTANTNGLNIDESYRVYITEGFPMLLEGYKRVDEGRFNIANREARWIEFYSEKQGILFHGMSAVVIKNNLLHVITCTSFPDHYAELEKDFRQMITSLQIPLKQ